MVDHGSALVALPNIELHFGTDLPTVQWVIIGTALAISALLLPMGRLGDMVGRKNVYMVGFSVFVAASAVAGFSPTLEVLIGAKVIQGVGSAMIQANAMAIIISVFPASERGKALGSHLSFVGVGAIAGPAVGGFLIDAFSWRAVFLMNLPVGVVTIVATALIIRSSQASQRNAEEDGTGFDWLGAVLSGLFLLAALLIIGNGHRAGWASEQVLAGYAAVALLLATFIWWELRVQSPMLDLRIFQRKVVSLGVSSRLAVLFGRSGRAIHDALLLAAGIRVQPEGRGTVHDSLGVLLGHRGATGRQPFGPFWVAAIDHRRPGPVGRGGVHHGHPANPPLVGGAGSGSADAAEHRHRNVPVPQQQRRAERG